MPNITVDLLGDGESGRILVVCHLEILFEACDARISDVSAEIGVKHAGIDEYEFSTHERSYLVKTHHHAKVAISIGNGT